jgi:hypothetical protein
MSNGVGKLVVQYLSRGVALGTLDTFFLMRCFGPVSPEDIHATVKCGDAVTAYCPSGGITIVAVDATSAFPSEETRRAAAEVTRNSRVPSRGQVVILLGDGFWASAIRGVLTTIASFSPSQLPRKVVRHEAEGIDWAIDAAGEPPQKYRASLLAALAELKSMAASPPSPSKSQTV